MKNLKIIEMILVYKVVLFLGILLFSTGFLYYFYKNGKETRIKMVVGFLYTVIVIAPVFFLIDKYGYSGNSILLNIFMRGIIFVIFIIIGKKTIEIFVK